MQNNQEIPIDGFPMNPKQITARQNANVAVKKLIDCDGRATLTGEESPTRSLRRTLSRNICQSMDAADKNRD